MVKAVALEIKDSEIASKVQLLLSKQIKDRIGKGYETYQSTLDDCDDNAYDWDQMLIEELLDGLQYMFKQNGILKKRLSQEILRNKQLEKVIKRGER